MRKRKNSEVSVPGTSPRGRPRANSTLSEAEDGIKTEFIVIRDAEISEEESVEAVEESPADLIDPKELASLSDKGRLNAVKYIEKYGEWLCCSKGRLFCIYCMKLENPHKRMIFAKGGYDPQDLPDGFDVNCRQHPACVTHVQAIAPVKNVKPGAQPPKKKARALPRAPTPDNDGKVADRYPRRVRKPSQAYKDMIVDIDEVVGRKGRYDQDEETDEDVYWKASRQRRKHNYMMESDSESDTETDEEPRIVHPLITHGAAARAAREKEEEERELDIYNHPYDYDSDSSDEDDYVRETEVASAKAQRPAPSDLDDIEAESAVAGLMLMASAAAPLYVH